MKHFISITDTPTQELLHVLEVARTLRSQRGKADAKSGRLLAGKTLAMIFEKPSLRTRASFEMAMIELGGHAMVLHHAEVGLGKRERPADVARVLSGMVQAIMARVFEHQKLIELAQFSSVPVINALSDYSHPCQALADVLTMTDEFGPDLRGRTMAFVGDGNNVARSLAVICGKFGMNFILAAPKGYQLESNLAHRLRTMTEEIKIEATDDPLAAVKNADVIYTDTWVSMGQENQAHTRTQVFEKYQVNGELVAAAPKHAIVLHCLPAYRGCEITEDVLEGAQSRAFPQAHNRLHAQKGLLSVLLGGV